MLEPPCRTRQAFQARFAKRARLALRAAIWWFVSSVWRALGQTDLGDAWCRRYPTIAHRQAAIDANRQTQAASSNQTKMPASLRCLRRPNPQSRSSCQGTDITLFYL